MRKKNKKDIPKNKNDTKRSNTAILKAVGQSSMIESRVIINDPFQNFYGSDNGNAILEPLYNPNLLSKLREESDILGSCIDAYATNIAGFGYEIQSLSEDNQTEEFLYESLFKYCSFDSSFTKIMKRVIADRETVGYGCFEVIRSSDGKPAGFTHIPAQEIRMCARQTKAQQITWKVKENGQIKEIPLKKKFRKYVQIVNEKLMYFKEFGDTRKMNCYTGEYSENVTEENEATEVVFFNIYCQYSPYGLPRYMGTLLNMVGSREAQELNYNYFKDGRHIPMAILVKGGHLTKDSETVLSEMKGGKSQHKYLVLEAEADEKAVSLVGEEDKNRVDVDIKPLATVMQQDGLFQQYCKNNRDIIRAAFRLPPIYTGESQDYNRATSDTARAITEEQVFEPERAGLEEEINNLFKNAMDVYDVDLRFKAPVINDDEAKANALKIYSDMGGLTPSDAREIASDILDKELQPYEGEWANLPVGVKTTDSKEPEDKTDEGETDESNAEENQTDNKETKAIEKQDNVALILKGLEELKLFCEADDETTDSFNV